MDITVNNIAHVIKLISRGILQVPECVSKEFTWKEDEIINLLENFYFGV